jgi:hypothetical protein
MQFLSGDSKRFADFSSPNGTRLSIRQLPPLVSFASRSVKTCDPKVYDSSVSADGSGRAWDLRQTQPIQAKAGAMPANNGLWFDDKDILPTRPKVAEGGPKESVPRMQRWPRPFAFEHGDLLRQSVRHFSRSPRLRSFLAIFRSSRELVLFSGFLFRSSSKGKSQFASV